MLAACEQATNNPNTTEQAPVTNADVPRSGSHPAAVKQKAKAESPEEDTFAQPTTIKALDLKIHKEDLLPNNTATVEHQPMLPNLFAPKKPEKKRLSVGGKLLLDDQPNVELRESIQGAQMSIQVRTP